MEMVFTSSALPHHGNLSTFALICYLPSVTVNFSVLLFDCPLPPHTPAFPSRVSSQLDLTSMWFCNEGACGCDRRLSHRAPNTHTLAYTSTNLTSLQTHGSHAVVWVQKQKKREKNVGINWQKCLDWANFYIYVPVYISTTLWPWVVFSSAVLHYSPHKGKECSFIF